MFHTILVPTDGSELADKAVLAAVNFAKANQSKVIGLSVAEPFPFSPLGETAFLPDPTTYEKGMRELAQLHVQKVVDEAGKAGVSCEAVTALNFDPAEEIAMTVKKYGCDAIFMATHGRRGMNRLLLGSVTQKVLVNAQVPVVVFR